jgi:GT2 family glycosyltransferase
MHAGAEARVTALDAPDTARPDAGTDAPLWSVMVPAHDRPGLLAETLASVLAQDPGERVMQIEVIDNSERTDGVPAVVEQVGRGRVAVYRQPTPVGMVENWNTCLARARGELVHLLHDDDLVLPGFYDRMGSTLARHTHAGAAISRFFTVDEHATWTGLSGIEQRHEGILADWLEREASGNRVQFAATVVRRSTFAAVGPFDLSLTFCSDWDMWKRIAQAVPVVYVPEVLACYRIHAAADTSRLVRTGANVADIRRSIEISNRTLPAEIARRVTRNARCHYAHAALDTASALLRAGDLDAARCQTREAIKLHADAHTRLRAAQLRLLILARRLRLLDTRRAALD